MDNDNKTSVTTTTPDLEFDEDGVGQAFDPSKSQIHEPLDATVLDTSHIRSVVVLQSNVSSDK